MARLFAFRWVYLIGLMVLLAGYPAYAAHPGLAVTAAMTIFVAACSGFCLYAIRRDLAAADSCAVEHLDGDALYVLDDTDSDLGIVMHFLQVCDHKFTLVGPWHGFVDGGPYRVYYVPRANIVVNIEAQPGWRPAPAAVSRLSSGVPRSA